MLYPCVGFLWCPCRSVSVNTGGWKKKSIPTRYLGQPSPYTHPHLVKHGKWGTAGADCTSESDQNQNQNQVLLAK